MCKNVEKRIRDEAKREGFAPEHLWISFRVTQLYETGAAIYVYLCLNYRTMGKSYDDLVETYERIEDAARDEVFLCGGCISHHHGVGKIRKRFMERTLRPMAIEWQKKIKENVDPTNIFGVNNTIIRSEEEAKLVFKNPILPPVDQK